MRNAEQILINLVDYLSNSPLVEDQYHWCDDSTACDECQGCRVWRRIWELIEEANEPHL